jgi:GntR family transcriptional regulator
MGRLKVGDRLPSEDCLSREFGVSPLTVRQALASLVEEGYLDRRPGRGTLIRKNGKERVVLNLSGDIDDLLSLGKETQTRVLRFDLVPGHDKASEFLKLNPNEPVYVAEKVRYWKRTPFMVVEEFVPHSLIGFLPIDQKVLESFYFILTQRKGIVPKGATQTIESITADQRIASLLRIAMGSPLFYMERTFFENEQRPVLLQIAYTCADHFKLSVHFEHMQRQKDVRWAAY